MLLSELFEGLPENDIKQLSIDSRLPMKDCIFFCLEGIRYNGHEFVEEAIKNGAKVIVYDDESINTSLDATFIKVSDVADCLNEIAAKFYNYPSRKLETYIAGGCDGNSSVSYLISSLLSNYKSTASIGVLGIKYKDKHLLSNSPSLTILDNQKYLNEFVKNDVKACILEANAMSLSYKKLDSINPDVFVYTTTNEQSSDYRELGRNYFDIMCSYFYTLDASTKIVLNRDDIGYNELIKAIPDNFYSYGTNIKSDYVIKHIVLESNQSSFELVHNDEKYTIKTKLIGLENVYNLTASLVSLNIMGYSLFELSLLVPVVEPLTGIYEPILLNQGYNVIVDNAIDINSISKLYDFARKITHINRKLYVIWGISSTDDDDFLKDFINITKEKADHLIITEKNTYNGDIFNVIDEYHEIFNTINKIVIEDRKIAIESTIDLLSKGDTLLIIGKGYEQFIIRNMGKESYDGDSNVAINAINKRIIEENIND